MELARLLNPQQLAAVEATEGPVLILAGAGSGKTRVITYRVAHLIQNKGVQPYSVLAVTFTNKAADQMKNRVRGLLQAARSSDPVISTFHSFCVRLLRREIEALGYTRDFTIYDESDQLQVIKPAMKDLRWTNASLRRRPFSPESVTRRTTARHPRTCSTSRGSRRGSSRRKFFPNMTSVCGNPMRSTLTTF